MARSTLPKTGPSSFGLWVILRRYIHRARVVDVKRHRTVRGEASIAALTSSDPQWNPA